MLREMIGAEWARRRAALGVTAAVYLSLPLLPVLVVRRSGGEAVDMATVVQSFLALGVMLAAALWGSGVWAPERKGRWVYFLSLPVDRVRLFALRYLAGLAWLAVPVAVLAAAAGWGAALLAPLPPGAHAYPGALAGWAVLASWFLYTAGFVVAARWERPGRVALVPVALLALCLVLALVGVADGVTGPVIEEMFAGRYTPLPLFSVPSLIKY